MAVIAVFDPFQEIRLVLERVRWQRHAAAIVRRGLLLVDRQAKLLRFSDGSEKTKVIIAAVIGMRQTVDELIGFDVRV